MPELPEVETTVRGLRPHLLHRSILEAWADWAKVVAAPPDIAAFAARIRGQHIHAVERRAKYIVIRLSRDTLLIHLKMTGRLYVVPDDYTDYADRWIHWRLQLDNQHQLRFSDSRKFGRVYLVEDMQQVVGDLGPEPLEPDFTLEAFLSRLNRRKGKIKALLLDQTFVAGIGNIYADEALHLAHIHPERHANTLTAAESNALWQAIREALTKGVEREGASVNWYRKPDGTKGNAQNGLLVYGQTGQVCHTCRQGSIEKIVIGQRGTHFCPHCQR